jgi:hypothetical protein
MSKVSEHLAGFHKTAAAHHAEMSVSHRALSEHFAKCASMSKVKQADESASDLLQACADAHSHAANSHDAQAEYHKSAMEACQKAQQAADLEKNRVEPTRVSGVAPDRTGTLTAVPRTGARPMPVTQHPVPSSGGVDFNKLIGLGDLEEV